MTARAPLRIGLVGAGGIAQTYAAALGKSGEVKLAGVADVRRDAAVALAENAGAPAFASHRELLAGAKLDGVLVCTPPSTHADVVCELLEAGLPVLCEKPFAIDVAAARRMAETARRTGLALSMGSKFRFVQDVIQARSIVASGVLGEIILLESSFTARVDMSRRWNSVPSISGGGVLIDNGSHSVDLIRWFAGPIAEVHAVAGRRIQALPVEDTMRLFTRTANGVMGSVDLSWSINKDLEYFLEVYGAQGTAKIGWKQSRYRTTSSSEWIVFGNGYDKVDAFRRQIDNFARAVRGEEALVVDAQDGVASVEVIAAAYASQADDAWTKVAHVGAAEAARA